MEKISIKAASANIFRTANHHTEATHSNPFGLSFKGNILQADVFSSAKTNTEEHKNVISRIADKGRAFRSAIVGNMNNFNTELHTRFNNGINKIVSFGKKIGHNTKELWRKANETNFVLDFGGLTKTIEGISSTNENKNSYKVEHLLKRPVSELETMFKQELEEIKA